MLLTLIKRYSKERSGCLEIYQYQTELIKTNLQIKEIREVGKLINARKELAEDKKLGRIIYHNPLSAL